MPVNNYLLVYAPIEHIANRIETIFCAELIPCQREECLLAVSTTTLSMHQSIVEVLLKNLKDEEIRSVRVGNTFTSSVFGFSDLESYISKIETSWFENALEQDQFSIFFQPIFDTSIGKPVAYESLIRLEADRLYNGEEILSAAFLRGKLISFDDYARDKAIRSASNQRRTGTKLFINFFPSAMEDPSICLDATLKSVQDVGFNPADVVFEIVEYHHDASMTHIQKICEFFRSHGFLYAVDDLGVGKNDLDAIRKLKPDYVKIDKSLIWQLRDPTNTKMIQDACRLSAEVGAQVIAEGIENISQAETVRDLGIQLMQGYCLGRPSPQMEREANIDLPDPQVVRDLLLLSSAVTTNTTPVTSSSARVMKDSVRVSSLRTRRIRP